MRKLIDKEKRKFKRLYPNTSADELAEMFGIGKRECYQVAQRVGARKPKKWTDRRLRLLRKHYANMPTKELAGLIGLSACSVFNKANMLGIHKSKEYFKRWGERVSSFDKSKALRFKKGHEPWNKGKRMRDFLSEESFQRMHRHTFKKGNRPHNRKPVGYESVTLDGYVTIKYAEGKKMGLKHHIIWQEKNGPIPRGYVLVFKDGDKKNCSLENLELISRAEHLRRIRASMPEEQKRQMYIDIQKKRMAKFDKDRMRIRWGLEPKTKLIKNYVRYGYGRKVETAGDRT